MPNRLSTATSPYLLQHADNPVDPGGVLFCLVPVQTRAVFDAHAATWD